MSSALQLLDAFEKSVMDGFPTDKEGAAILDQLKRVEDLIAEARSFYRARLAKDPACVPGWGLRPGAVRRSLGDPAKVWDRLFDTLSVEQFMVAVKLEIGRLQDQWALANGVAPSDAKPAFNALLGDLITEFQNAPSLVKIK